MLALEEVGSSLTRVKKWGDGLVGGATMHTTALYLKTNSFTNSIMHFIGSSTKQHKKERKKSVSIEPRKEKTEGPRWLPRAERFCYRRINTTTSLALYYSFICLAPSGLSAAGAQSAWTVFVRHFLRDYSLFRKSTVSTFCAVSIF